jgi:hypothetical protein
MRILIEKVLLEKINSLKKGSILFAEDFLSIGSSTSINRALSRLLEKGVLIRLAKGIYLYPKINNIIGPLYPSLNEIALEIAKRDKARIIPTGIEALNQLNLSTQVPMNVVYLTDGSARKIKVGNRSIKFKKTSPKNLSIKSEITGLVIQALRALGKDGVSDEQLIILLQSLKKESRFLVEHDAKLAPSWIREIMKSAINEIE